MSLGIKSFAATANISGENLFNAEEDTSIRVKYEPGDEFSNPELNDQLGAIGLPTNFGAGIVTKGDKKTYYCDLCLVELNSEDTMISHKNGQRHLKKVQSFKEKQRQEGHAIDPNTYIRPSQPTKLAPKKIPIRLRAKLSETSTAVVGLRDVVEVISYSKVEMEPHYECQLCHNQGEANGMFNHVLGRGHREKFFFRKYGDDNFSPRDIADMAEKERENDQLDNIVTIYSDEKYPWPSGKAPWSLEQGGTGIPPTYGRKGRDELKIKRDPEAPLLVGNNNENVQRNVKIDIRGLPPLYTHAALDSMYQAVLNILEKTAAFHEQNVADPSDQGDVATLNDLIRANLNTLRDIRLQDSMYYSTPNPFHGSEALPGPSGRSRRSQSPPRNGRHSSSRSIRSRSRSPKQSRRSRSRSPKRRYRNESPPRSYREFSPVRYRNDSPPRSSHREFSPQRRRR